MQAGMQTFRADLLELSTNEHNPYHGASQASRGLCPNAAARGRILLVAVSKTRW